MWAVTDSAALLEAVQRVCGAAAGFTTSFFTGREQAEAWVRCGMLRYKTGDGYVLVWRRDRDFLRLYHAAADVGALRRALAENREQAGETVLVAELVGRPRDLEAAAAVYAEYGFTPYRRLFRMSRLASLACDDTYVDDQVDCAAPEEAGAVLALIERSFDRHAEQIPELDEIREAVARRNVLVVRRGAALAGLLFYESKGMTSTLRYWLVDKAYRGNRIGMRLLRSFLDCCRSSRRLILWVVEENTGAIRSYEHVGFKTEGLMDQIMIASRDPLGPWRGARKQ